MRKRTCAVCDHPQFKQIIHWRYEGKDDAFITANTSPFISPYDLMLHDRHEKKESKHNVAAKSSSDKHETIYSRREEVKKKLDRVSKLLDRELDAPTSQKGLKDAAQEFRMFTQQLNEIDAEIAAQEAAKQATVLAQQTSATSQYQMTSKEGDRIIKVVQEVYQSQIDSGLYGWCPYGCNKPVKIVDIRKIDAMRVKEAQVQ